MRFTLAIVWFVAFPSSGFATSYYCQTQDGNTKSEFEFQNGRPMQADLTFLGIHHDNTMMQSLIEDYQEIPGRSLYVEVSVQDFGTNGISFNVEYLPGSETRLQGFLNVFSEKPMKKFPLRCLSSR